MAARNIAVYYPERGGLITVMADVGRYAVLKNGLCVPLNKKGEHSNRHIMDACVPEDFGRMYGFTPEPSPGVQMYKQTLEAIPALKPTMYREVITLEKIEEPVAPVPVAPEPELTHDAEGEPLRTATVEG